MGTTRKTLSIFWRANKAHPQLFFGMTACFSAGMILQKIVLPLIAASAINTLIAVHAAGTPNYWPILLPYLIGFGVTVVIAQIGVDVALLLLSKLETKVRPELQLRLFDTLVNQSLNFHANNFGGALVNQAGKFTNAYIILTDMFAINVTLTIITSLIAISVVMVMLPLVGLIMLAWTIFFVWLNMTLTKRRTHLSRIAAQAESVVTAHLADAIGNISAIKAFAYEAGETEIHKAKAHDRAIKKYRSWIQTTKNDFLFGLMMGLLQLGVLIALVYMVMQHGLSIGALLLVQVYVTQLIMQLWSLSGLTRNIEQALSDSAEMTEILGTELEIQDPPRPEPLHVKKGLIEFKNVTFTHDGSDDALFTDFSLVVKPGEKIGLVGRSGSGKTSLTRLLLRFVDIDGGEICIDGHNIAHVRQADLRAHIAYVPQEPLLFHRTLSENIAYGNPTATEADIKKAAKLAHADEFIQTLPKGYDTMVGERGVKLSGGQRQRIAIARAVLKNAPILVLDEATSALDSESERLIQDALKKLMHGRTTIVIAHRLSTIQNMDRIVVLDEGAIAEQGSHADLLQHSGIYADLWKHQSGGFLED